MASRLSYEEAEQVITDALPADGGQIDYNELVDSLNQAGNGVALRHFNALSNAKRVRLSVIAGEAGPVLRVSRGEEQP